MINQVTRYSELIVTLDFSILKKQLAIVKFQLFSDLIGRQKLAHPHANRPVFAFTNLVTKPKRKRNIGVVIYTL
ncbi:MAG TPA: hypothetical protein VH796_06130 [Nitrososphaeraceae archaeon]